MKDIKLTSNTPGPFIQVPLTGLVEYVRDSAFLLPQMRKLPEVCPSQGQKAMTPQATTKLPASTPYNWLLKSSKPPTRIKANNLRCPGATQSTALDHLNFFLKVSTGQQRKLSQSPKAWSAAAYAQSVLSQNSQDHIQIL